METWGGHPDLSFFLDSWHSQFVAQPGNPQPPRDWQLWSNPELAAMSAFSPYPPNDSYVVPPDIPPSWVYPLGTTSRRSQSLTPPCASSLG